MKQKPFWEFEDSQKIRDAVEAAKETGEPQQLTTFLKDGGRQLVICDPQKGTVTASPFPMESNPPDPEDWAPGYPKS